MIELSATSAERRVPRHRIVTFTTLYPNASAPNHGVFVENRLRHLVATGEVAAEVVAPVPWFPLTNPVFGRYAVSAATPTVEIRYEVPIVHPRYLVIPKIGMLLSPATLYWATRSLIANHSTDFDIIDAHYFYPDGVAAAKLGRTLKKPVVITVRGSDINCIARKKLPRRMIISASRSAAALITVSQSLKNALVELGLEPHKITVLRNGVDLDTFRMGDREYARAELCASGHVLLSVGNLVELKGHDLIIRALQRLISCTLLLAGDGPELLRLKALATKLGVDKRIKFLGSVPHREMHRLYNAADALILASSREGWPNVLLEAMACGTRVIATPVGGIPEIVSTPEAGILLRNRTPEGIVEAVEALISSPLPRNATRAFAEKFSWAETSAGQIRVFDQVLGWQDTFRPRAL